VALQASAEAPAMAKQLIGRPGERWRYFRYIQKSVGETDREGKPSDINQLIFRHNGKSRHLWSLASQSSVLYEYNKEHIPFSFSRNAATSPGFSRNNTGILLKKREDSY
jgi:hypothetical protein